jgi:hypothetical protein
MGTKLYPMDLGSRYDAQIIKLLALSPMSATRLGNEINVDDGPLIHLFNTLAKDGLMRSSAPRARIRCGDSLTQVKSIGRASDIRSRVAAAEQPSLEGVRLVPEDDPGQVQVLLRRRHRPVSGAGHQRDRSLARGGT